MSLAEELARGGAIFYVQRNYEIVRQVIAKSLIEKGVVLEPLSSAVKKGWVDKLLWTVLPAREIEPKGAFVYIPPYVKVQAPVSFCFTVDKGSQSVHNVLVIGEGSEVTVTSVCSSAGDGKEHKGYTEVFLGKRAKLDYVMVHSWAKDTRVEAELGVIVDSEAVMNELYVSLRSPYELRGNARFILRKKASLSASTIYLATLGRALLETGVTIESENSSAEVTSRVVAAKGSIVRQPILLEAKAPNTKGHVECKGLQLSHDSVIETIPSLRSAHGGAQLTHEAAIGKISEEELAYLTSKGFTEDEAVTLLVRGFLELGIKGLPESLKPQITSILDLLARAATG
ncbi:MAG: SufD family Fe-S cluster assembly protein [Thermofilaceae archaeon]|nr:SufD family Fe-S cluster assembly protein [Thermofilaceae archaeon]MCX8180780.1 SufD family Fe-S cluster assembly protein [Thermofilaceae archaeon]MDW8004824.1 SufD family Fe-S cluster assembly protein [Thermofilaceae archaeon]